MFKEDNTWIKDFNRSILNNAGMFVIAWKTDGNLLKFNTYGETVTGFLEEEVSGERWKETLFHQEDSRTLMDMFKNLHGGGSQPAYECSIKCKSGKEIAVLWNNVPMVGSGSNETITSIGVNITEYKEAERKLALGYQELEAVYEELAATEEEVKQNYEELQAVYEELSAAEEEVKQNYEDLQLKEQELAISEERFKLALEGSQDAVWDWDIKRNKAFISERWKEMLGYGKDDLKVSELIWKELIHPDDKERAFQAQQEHLKGKTEFYINEYRLKMKNGEYKWIQARGKALRDENGEPIRIAGSQTDISERKKFEEMINFMAYYDSLTGLPNRVLFEKLLNESISESKAKNLRGAVLFLDLDNFKTVNDTFGHAIGDDLLKSVAAILKSFEAEDVKISRFGGDEFVIMVHDIKSDEYVTNLAANIVQALSRPWQIQGKEFYNTVSIGIVFYPDSGCDAQSILSNADCAMYSVKEAGKDNYRIYSYKMNSRFMERINMENNLRHALERGEFILHYQPQINQRSGEIVGAEALIRWNSPETGMVPPGDFIPIAEATGLIVPIGEWVLREACRQNKEWQGMGYAKFPISVNLSARQLKQPDLIEKIKLILDDTGLEPQWLDLEITESIAINDIEFAIKLLTALKELGVGIALDDFGTGYSSLSYLRKLPMHTLKIDKSFVNEINENVHAAAITEAIIVMAHKMNLKVIAEGVETWGQHELLLKENCDIAQGYLFSRPLQASAIEKLIEDKDSIPKVPNWSYDI